MEEVEEMPMMPIARHRIVELNVPWKMLWLWLDNKFLQFRFQSDLFVPEKRAEVQ